MFLGNLKLKRSVCGTADRLKNNKHHRHNPFALCAGTPVLISLKTLKLQYLPDLGFGP